MAATVAWPVPFFLGGRLCLDFVNTVNSRTRPATKDYIPDVAALLGWCSQLAVFDADTLSRLQSMAETQPRVAEAAHARAKRFRETLFAIFQNTIDGEGPSAEALGALGELVSAGRQRQRLKKGEERFVWSWDKSRLDLDAPLQAVALSAEQMLTKGDLQRLKACPGPEGCGWLFYDETKNASRRWCSMEHCGGAAKARRHAARLREKRL
ncbi:CGNR zinc finger domain-containing protein [Nitratireductor kimnyeongensis]|uniref:CGNR zinc finger domain-containing protein n=1 Tax=Nitratireductor kimnyeongensis TaxID=430679 RepID=A0ABW0TDC8_9HYPH|nr:ABATE domain-containing protein [Nitratireductor kimnyeongensis]QZZ37165.1 ABATE domain-containing protein [Nitratireductor kimnyeongensis]